MRPSPIVSLIPVIILVGLICLTVHFFGANAMNGGSQICMLFAAATAAGLSMRIYKMPWRKIEEDRYRKVAFRLLDKSLL